MKQSASSDRIWPVLISTLILGLVGALGGMLISWPPFVALQRFNRLDWVNATAFLFPLGYFVITRTAKSVQSSEFIGLLIGLFYGGILWLQVTLFLLLDRGLTEVTKLDYLQGHAYDLFAVAAIVGAVGYFSADSRPLARISSLAVVFALTGAITGFSATEIVWANHNTAPSRQLWLSPIVWALTGIWYGLCIGILAPDPTLARMQRGENETFHNKPGRAAMDNPAEHGPEHTNTARSRALGEASATRTDASAGFTTPSEPQPAAPPSKLLTAAERADIRAWAIKQGLKVSQRGKVPARVIAAYQSCQQGTGAGQDRGRQYLPSDITGQGREMGGPSAPAARGSASASGTRSRPGGDG